MQPTTYQTPPTTVDDLPNSPDDLRRLSKIFRRRPTTYQNSSTTYQDGDGKVAGAHREVGRSSHGGERKPPRVLSIVHQASLLRPPSRTWFVLRTPLARPMRPSPRFITLLLTTLSTGHSRSLTVHNFCMIVGTAISVRVTMSCPRNCPASTVYQQQHQQSSSRRSW